MAVVVCVLCVFLLPVVVCESSRIQWSAGNSSGTSISVSTSDGTYSVSYRGSLWFKSSATSLLVDGAMRSSSDRSLVLTSYNVIRKAFDKGFGEYTALELNWSLPTELSTGTEELSLTNNSGVIWSTTFKAFDNGKTLAFTQHFPHGIPKFSINTTASASKDCSTIKGEGGCWCKPGSSFPSLDLTTGKIQSVGFINYGEIGRTTRGTNWSQYRETKSGPDGVPLAMLDKTTGTVMLLSPSAGFFDTVVDKVADTLRCGVIGSAKAIPIGFSTEIILHFDQGMTKTVMGWGDGMLRKYGKQRAAPDVNIQVCTIFIFVCVRSRLQI